MTKMFIANTTQQVQDFQYRLPENPKIVKQTIPIGGQIQIPGDLTVHDIEAIIEQHSPYGMVAVSEIDRTKPFIGVCYSLDKAVTVNKIMSAIEHNGAVLDARGREIRKEAAVSVNNAIEEQSRDFRALDIGITEVRKEGGDVSVNENIRVDRSAGPQPRGRSSRQRRAA